MLTSYVSVGSFSSTCETQRRCVGQVVWFNEKNVCTYSLNCSARSGLSATRAHVDGCHAASTGTVVRKRTNAARVAVNIPVKPPRTRVAGRELKAFSRSKQSPPYVFERCSCPPSRNRVEAQCCNRQLFYRCASWVSLPPPRPGNFRQTARSRRHFGWLSCNCNFVTEVDDVLSKPDAARFDADERLQCSYMTPMVSSDMLPGW